ncbi:MAG: DUF2946 domain-containing protein [Gammaproteobacteria bacterium]|nr:DUF2946 domain-containing protein [Gammaproteobacteria bacterium]
MQTIRAPHHPLIWLTLLALGLRALIPVGFMPNLSGEDGTPIIICSAGVYRTILIDGSGDQSGPDHAPGQVQVQAHCPYSLFLGEPALPGANALAAFITPAIHRPVGFIPVDSTLHQPENSHQPRAPPLFS